MTPAQPTESGRGDVVYNAATLGLLLRGLRRSRNLTARDLAARTHLSAAYVTAIESGRRLPRRKYIILKLADGLAKNDKHRVQLYDVLLSFWEQAVSDRRRLRLRVPGYTPIGTLLSPRMPLPFLNRFTKDLARHGSLAGLDEALVDLTQRNRILSLEEVAAVAELLKQPPEEYLLLAGYNPFILRRLPVETRRLLKNLLLKIITVARKDAPVLFEMIAKTVDVFSQYIESGSDQNAGP